MTHDPAFEGNTPPDSLLALTRRLSTLNEISRVVASTLELRTLYDTIYQQIGRVMDASQFFIALRRPGSAAIDIPYLREEERLYLDQRVPFGGNTTSVIIEQGVSLLYLSSEEYKQFECDHGLKSVLVGDRDSESGIFVPLHTGSHTIGALSVQSLRPRAYTREDKRTLTIIAAQAAVAIENARLYAQSQATVRNMGALLRVAQSVNSSLDLSQVLQGVLAGVADVVPHYVASILLPDSALQELTVAAVAGQDVDMGRTRVRVPFSAGIPGRAFATGRPVVVRQTRSCPDYVGPENVQSEVAVPLKRGDSVVGVLDVQRQEADAFSSDDQNLLLLFASEAAIAIENARLFSAEQTRVVELQTIQSVVQRLTVLHDLPSMVGAIEQELKQLIDYHSCRVFLLDRTGTRLGLASADPGDGELQLDLGKGVAGWIAKHGESVRIEDLVVDGRAVHLEGTPVRAESMIGTPLIYEGRVRGAITLTQLGAGKFDANSLRLLEIIAGQAAIAFDRARLYDELRQQAITDELTKLHNRRYLHDRLVEEMSRASRNGHPLATMMVDIDKFKRVNDAHGHRAGDVVLADLATVIRAVVRAEDVVARYGGEEFCVLLPEVGLAAAAQIAERLRTTIGRHRLPTAAGVGSVTVSVGVAELAPGEGGTEIFSRADRAMYEVKRGGGNGVCASDGAEFHLYS